MTKQDLDGDEWRSWQVELNAKLRAAIAFLFGNTLIFLGKTREGNRIGRGIYIAKHRGSRCSDEIVPYRIDDQGLYVG